MDKEEIKQFRNRATIDFDSDSEEIASELFHQLSDLASKTTGVKWKGAGMSTHKLGKVETLTTP